MIYRWKCDVCGIHCQSAQERIGGFTHCLQRMRPISEDEYWASDPDEPDRPRRDVSIEEAERMPMTDEELDAIEAKLRIRPDRRSTLRKDVRALVAEVRRLRARERKIRERLEPPLLDFGP